ncbi:MAG: ParB/RepB/Spo0J family partition protein, partial [Candidatus Komeilibacteria bacterium]|nr:ParB/RepB/Spo0J family partition protein [Candidatus Komeilibacteria bacterium]
GLGRGLSSLIPRKDNKEKDNYFSASTFSARPLAPGAAVDSIHEVAVNEIVSNKYQPRTHFAEKPLQELAASIKEHGILQPLVVVSAGSGGYELIAGERRLRAAKIAGLARVPVIIREASELQKLELALIENIQRADLNPIESALAYQKLNDEFGLTHEEISKKMGKSRPAVSNTIRLLSLPDEIQQALSEGAITEGHAKVLMEIKDEAKRLVLFKQVLQQKLTISDTSQEVKKVVVARHARKLSRDPNFMAFEEDLREKLGTKVSIRRRGKNGGEIVIEYYGEEEFKDLMEKLTI